MIAELQIVERGVSIHFASTGTLTGEWDGDRVAQILANLIGNAIRHGDANRGVSVTAMGTAEQVLLEVHNFGHPIPAVALNSIFEPMVRHTKDAETLSVGLGLYIASQAAIAHGGTIEVASTEADGTTFIVHLPRAAHDAA